MSPREPPIRCAGLTKRYGDTIGVQDLDLEVHAGTVTGFLGSNGAGKTTVLRTLVGLLRPTEGSALLWGRPAGEAEARRHIGYMPADPAFYPRLSGAENLDLLAAVREAESPDRGHALELLELSRAELLRPVGEYSSGMVQKLALVQAVQHRPELVILDEPANRLDPLAHRRFEQLIRGIAGDGRTVLLSSHTLSEVEDVCDDVAMLREGRLLDVRGVHELAQLVQRRLWASFSSPPARIPEGVSHGRIDGNELTGRIARGDVGVLRALAQDPALLDLTVEPGSLEDAFVELYEGPSA